jgi:hypothetical protein
MLIFREAIASGSICGKLILRPCRVGELTKGGTDHGCQTDSRRLSCGHTLSSLEGAAKLIDFLKQAFDAQETFRMPMLNADKDLDVMLNGSYFRRGLVRLAFG